MPVVHLTGEFDLSNRPALERHLQALQHGDRRVVVIDLGAATFIDVTIIDTLVLAYRNGLDIIIRGASGVPRRVLHLLAMDRVFTFEDEH